MWRTKMYSIRTIVHAILLQIMVILFIIKVLIRFEKCGGI